MSAIKAAPAVSKLYDAQDEIDAERGHLLDLMYVREVLAAHGATVAELRECDKVIETVRLELEQSRQRASADLPNAA